MGEHRKGLGLEEQLPRILLAFNNWLAKRIRALIKAKKKGVLCLKKSRQLVVLFALMS